MLPPAPVTFSTTTVWPRLFVIRSAMIRPIASVGPPAENGTTIVTGRAGKFCADATVQPKTIATAKNRNPFMAPPPLRTMVTLRSAIADVRSYIFHRLGLRRPVPLEDAGDARIGLHLFEHGVELRPLFFEVCPGA